MNFGHFIDFSEKFHHNIEKIPKLQLRSHKRETFKACSPACRLKRGEETYGKSRG